MQIADQAWLAANQLNVPNIGISIQSNGQMSSGRDGRRAGQTERQTDSADGQIDRQRVGQTCRETASETGAQIAGQTEW